MNQSIFTIAVFVVATAALSLADERRPPSSDTLLSKVNSTQVKAAEMIAASQKRLKMSQERTDALFKREESLIARSEANTARFEKILATWEKQQAQYQKYLDSLTKK